MKFQFVVTTFFFFTVSVTFAQIPAGSFFLAKDYSKDVSLYYGKTFVIQNVLGKTTDFLEFQIDPLVAANSGELTTLIYRCKTKNKEGLILGFYGNRWNESGTDYKSYSFKDLSLEKANELIEKIETGTKGHLKFIEEDTDNNNIYFQYDDMTFLIYNTFSGTKIRVYWNGFDSEWNWTEFKKTKTRMIKKLK